MIRNRLFSIVFGIATLLIADPRAGAAEMWRGWDDGLAEAAKREVPVVVDVYTDWCGWCKRMDRDVYARADVREYLEANFVPVKINAESSTKASYMGKDLTSRTLAAGFRVTGYPTTIFLRADGKHMVSVPGYIPREQFMLVLRYIAEGHMDRGVDFRDFQQNATPAKKN